MREVLTFGKFVGDPLSLRIIALLRQGELCACEIKDVLDGTGSAVDLRLRSLSQAGIVWLRKREGWPAYRLARRYTDLVETLFEAFESELDWDPDLTTDLDLLRQDMLKRREGWCPPRNAGPTGRVGP